MVDVSLGKTFCVMCAPVLLRCDLRKMRRRRGAKQWCVLVAKVPMHTGETSRISSLILCLVIQEVAAAAEAAKENEGDACNAQDGQKKASWHRATGSVARPQPPKNTLPDEPPAPDAASHGVESGAHNRNKRANQVLSVTSRLPMTPCCPNIPPSPHQVASVHAKQPQLMLRTPALRARVIPAEAAKETSKGDSQGCLSQEPPPSSGAPSVVAFGRKPLSFKRKFVPPRTTS